MSRLRIHTEDHNVDRIGWLRAAVLGANDGIVSTASLIVGVAAAAAKPSDILLTGVAGLVAGAMSMAAGEYVSVSSQSDTEHADLARESKELADTPDFEREELAQIYVKRGVDHELAVRLQISSWPRMLWVPMLGTNLEYPRSPPPVPCKRHSPRPPRFQSVPRCRSRW